MTSEAGSFDLDRILTTLERHLVEYVMVGGLGARAHGATRPTLDVDFVPRSTIENLDRLAAALRELGARLRVGGMSDEEARKLPVVIDGATLAAFGSTTWATDAGPIDVLHDLPTAYGRRSYDDLLSTSMMASLDGIGIRVASLGEIIASKRHADRAKDREAIPELEQLEPADSDRTEEGS
jgi:nucleotidyltransferase AbiEii toxin of type IV toxin-antitoxin system